MSFEKLGSKLVHRLGSYRVPVEVTSSGISNFFEALDCPRSLAAHLLYKYGEHEQLANLKFNPLDYNTLIDGRDACAATHFLAKSRFLSLPYDLDATAMLKFEKFELQCKHTNSRFRNLTCDQKYTGRTVWLHNAVIRKIAQILGDFDPQSLFDVANWGPGASTLLREREASSPNKFQCETGITRDLYHLISPTIIAGNYPLWFKHLEERGEFPTFQIGNKVVTVPKDATANRVIAIEPGLNLWFQKAIGQIIRKRLKRYGIDLRYQTRNQQLAKLGSKNLRLATIDFSSASDSIANLCVRELLPPDWYSIMDSCRSHYGVQGSSSRKWEKFSSMGNGFTFELETLIFFATALCSAEYHQIDLKVDPISVYGDDVIIPLACLDSFSLMCDFYGFTINMKKSHYSSTYRESCGSHFINGVDIKPIYLQDKLSDIPSVYRFANAVRRLAHRRCVSFCCDTSFRSVFYHLVQSVPKPFRFRIPEGIGDGGFISNFDEATPRRARHGIEGYHFVQVTESSISRQFDGVGLLLARLWDATQSENLLAEHRTSLNSMRSPHQNLSSSVMKMFSHDRIASGNLVAVRKRSRLRLSSKSLVKQWYDLGPWL